jgi:trans-aconitate methyltransferase
MAQSEEQKSWSDFYKALAGRPPRPLFIEAVAYSDDRPATTVARWAVDLGCGDGTETLALLQAGWHVLAIDQQSEAISWVQSKVPPELRPRLQTRVTAFEELHLPPVDFVYAGFSLPFCRPQHFVTLWTTIATALHPGGMLAGQLFGEHDSWASEPEMTFHTRTDVLTLLEPFEIKVLREVEEDGQALRGPKHWHIFHIIARKRQLP